MGSFPKKQLDFMVAKFYIFNRSGLRLPNRSLLWMYFAAGGSTGLPTEYRPSAVPADITHACGYVNIDLQMVSHF